MTTTTPVKESRRAAERARWSSLASVALLLAALGPLVMLVAGLAWGLDIGDEVGFFVVSIAAAAGAAALVRRGALWSRVVAMVLALLFGAMLFWTAFSLALPTSFFDFVPAIVVLPGALLAIGATVAAIRAQKRGDLVTRPEGGEARAIAIVLSVVLVLAGVSGVLTALGRDTVDDPSVAASTVTTSDFEFDEDSYAVAPGDQILVTNDDPFFHTFTVDGLDIDVDLLPGSEKLVTIPTGAEGSFVLYCEPHTSDPEDPSDDDMAAELVVG